MLFSTTTGSGEVEDVHARQYYECSSCCQRREDGTRPLAAKISARASRNSQSVATAFRSGVFSA